MSIKVKLYLSYLAMAFVPVMMMISFGLIIYYLGGKEDLRDFTNSQQFERFDQALVFGELTYVIDNQIERLDDLNYVEDLQNRLGEVWAGLVIMRDGNVSNVSSFLNEMSPNENWQRFSDITPHELSFRLYRFGAHEVFFKYKDGSDGKLILLRRTDTVPVFWHPLALVALLSFITITGSVLTILVSRSIIKPLLELRAAALRIKDGDLSYSVASSSVKRDVGNINEIVQVSKAFEEMRIRLKDSIDQSLQYEENRKQLLSHISHDLKTPISAIKGYIEGIMDGIANTDEMRQRYMQTIYNKAEHMDRLIDELFLFSKLDLQTVAFDFKTIEIARYLEHFMEEQRFDMEKLDIELHFHSTASDTLTVTADPEKLQRVLLNILSNCTKYLVTEGDEKPLTVMVRVGENRSFVIIEIEDNGPGIEEDDLPYIFDRFYRAEKSRNSETGGSGLGLAIVKQIVDGHNGDVRAVNTQQGALFTIMLPKQDTARMVKVDATNTYH